MGIETFRDVASGPVALLGGGESVMHLDLEDYGRSMLVIGINESWKGFTTQWRVFIDRKLQTFVEGETVFYPAHENERPLPRNVLGVPIRHLLRNNVKPEFMGFHLDEGTYGYFGGMLALEVATWCGFNPIYLLGFDCSGGYWFDPKKRTPGSEKTHAAWEAQLVDAIAHLNKAGRTVVWEAGQTKRSFGG